DSRIIEHEYTPPAWDYRFVSPRSPCPFGTFFLAFVRLSAANDFPTATVLPKVPSDFRRAKRLSPFGSMTSRLRVLILAGISYVFSKRIAAGWVHGFSTTLMQPSSLSRKVL